MREYLGLSSIKERGGGDLPENVWIDSWTRHGNTYNLAAAPFLAKRPGAQFWKKDTAGGSIMESGF
jgi:hypothetical protein